jgi:hypothetical protein
MTHKRVGPMPVSDAVADRMWEDGKKAVDELIAERAKIDAAIRILSDDRLPLQSRVNDARSILSR